MEEKFIILATLRMTVKVVKIYIKKYVIRTIYLSIYER